MLELTQTVTNYVKVPNGRSSAPNPVTHRLYRPQGRGLARDLPQAPRPGCGRAAAPGPLPRPWLVEFGIVVVRPEGARRRRILGDERLRRARLRRVDVGSSMNQLKVVLRGLDPRIQAFGSGAGRRGW